MVRMLLGIGNPLHGDDGIGNYVAARFRARGWNAIDCGTMPENFTGVVRRHRPEILILVDATRLGLSPGEFRIVDESRIEDVSLGTHNLPLSLLMGYLAEMAGQVIFIGIQPASLGEGERLSPEAIEGAERLMALLRDNRIRDIECLGGVGNRTPENGQV